MEMRETPKTDVCIRSPIAHESRRGRSGKKVRGGSLLAKCADVPRFLGSFDLAPRPRPHLVSFWFSTKAPSIPAGPLFLERDVTTHFPPLT